MVLHITYLMTLLNHVLDRCLNEGNLSVLHVDIKRLLKGIVLLRKLPTLITHVLIY